jgi:hypothetical protein
MVLIIQHRAQRPDVLFAWIYQSHGFPKENITYPYRLPRIRLSPFEYLLLLLGSKRHLDGNFNHAN